MPNATATDIVIKLEGAKLGAMISSANMKKLQGAHDALKELGVSCEPAGEEKRVKFSLKNFKQYEMTGAEYAIHEGWDIQTCCSIISQVASLCQDEIREGELQEAEFLCNICMSLMDHCKGECQEMMDGIRQGDNTKHYATLKPAHDYMVEDQSKGGNLDLSYIKRLGLKTLPKSVAVKYVGKNTIAHPVFIWGDAKKTDLEIEFFNRDSDFWDDSLKDFPRVLTWDHGQDEKFSKFEPSPVIGKTVKYHDDDIARWAESVIETDKQYRKFIDQFIEEKRLGYSSDSAPQYIIREPQGKAVWLKMWPWFGGALTASPCEPRMKLFTPEFLKSLGIELPDVSANKKRYEVLQRQSNFLKLRER